MVAVNDDSGMRGRKGFHLALVVSPILDLNKAGAIAAASISILIKWNPFTVY